MSARIAGAAPILALIQAAGLPGFRSSEPGAEPLNAAAADDAEPVLALIHASGLPGFRARAPGVKPPDLAEPGTAASVDHVVALIQASDLPGFVRRDYGSALTSPSPLSVRASAAPAPKAESATTPLTPASARKTTDAAGGNAIPVMSKRDYFVLEVTRGRGEAILAELESKLGMGISSLRPGGAVYSSRATTTGIERALSFGYHQLRDLQSIIPALNSSGLRARIGPIPVNLFAPTGPGAIAPFDVGGPEQITSDAIAALKAAFR